MAKFKPTFAQLALLDWLHEGINGRFLIRLNTGTSGGFDMYETAGRNEETGKIKVKCHSDFAADKVSEALTRRIGGSRSSIDLSPLIQQHILIYGSTMTGGTAIGFHAFVAQLDRDPEAWHYNSSYFVMSKKVGEPWWKETGKPLFEQMKAKRATEREKAKRLVLVGRNAPIEPQWPAALIKQLPQGLQFPIPDRRGIRPQAYATVVKETDKRLYLEDIHHVREVETYSYGSRESTVISGNRTTGAFVEREHVIVDHADMGIINKLTALDAEYQDDVTRIAVDFAERMLPIMKEMDQRFFQKDNEREMVFEEAIQEFKNRDQADASLSKSKARTPKA